MFCASEKIAYGRNYIFRSFLEKLSSSFALHPPPTVEVRGGGGGVFAVDSIPAATTYGPFLGKWAVQPEEHKYAWEVSDPDTVVHTQVNRSSYNSDAQYVHVKFIVASMTFNGVKSDTFTQD